MTVLARLSIAEETPLPWQLLYRKTLIEVAYGFRGLSIIIMAAHGGMQTGLMMEKELRVLHLVDNRK